MVVGYGVDAQANLAIYTGEGKGGKDSWSGNFSSINVSLFGYSGSVFWVGDWIGISLGRANELFSASYTSEQYINIYEELMDAFDIEPYAPLDAIRKINC